MQFVPTSDYIYPWPVKLILPSLERAGEAVIQEFTAQFRLMPDTEALQMQEALRAATTAEAYVAASKDQIRRILIGWDEATVLGANKRAIPFSVETLDEYLTSAPFRDAVIEAYGRSLAKRPEEGN